MGGKILPPRPRPRNGGQAQVPLNQISGTDCVSTVGEACLGNRKGYGHKAEPASSETAIRRIYTSNQLSAHTKQNVESENLKAFANVAL